MPEKPPRKGSRDDATSRLLHRLNSDDAGPAWAEFLDQYAGLIMKVTGQFDFEVDQTSECFLFVCEKLAERGFRRLQRFNTRGKAPFASWLTTVVFNLCVDWHRHEFGRVRMLPAISALSQFDQQLYQLRFERGLSREECYQTLRDDFPDLTREQFSDALKRIFRVLTPRQRWQINVNMRRRHRRAEIEDGLNLTNSSQLSSHEELPESAASKAQNQQRLSRALAALSHRQRMILQLRYYQGLTYQSIARVCHIDDLFKARRAVEAALSALSDELQSLSVEVRKK